MSEPNIPRFDPADPRAFLDALHAATVAHAEGQINWYVAKRTPKRIGSQAIRVLTVFFLIVGALCPLIDSIGIGGLPKFGQWGYVALAVGAGVMSYDRYFGLSTGWVRYSLTGMTLETLLVQFKFDWASLSAKQLAGPLTQEDVLHHIQLARDFAVQVEEQVKLETDAWALEFQGSLAELQKSLGTAKDAAKPGAVRIKLANGQSYRGVEVTLNDRAMKRLDGVAEALLDQVPPGRYTVAVAAVKDGVSLRDARVVEVTPGAVVVAELALPA